MSNFEIFDIDRIKLLIEPFANGMSSHITPIKYEAISPDIFALLFRTTGKDNKDHYFVSLEFDYIKSLDKAKFIIENWHRAPIVEFWNPESDENTDGLSVKVNDTYKVLLAEVERPQGDSYWATNLIVRNRESIDGLVNNLDVKNKDVIRKSLNEIFQESPDVTISLFIHEDEGFEVFYN